MLSILGMFSRGRLAYITVAHYFGSFRLYTRMDSKTAILYEEAVYALNGLQSNAETIQKARAERDANAHKNLTETTRHLQTLGVELSDLDELNIIHVAGTKGKGSTCAFTESILRRHGFKTGFYSSPHLVSVNERIQINGLPIDKSIFAEYFWEVYTPLQQSLKDGERMPPYFMFLTVMAFYIFVKEQIQAAVIEVGVGGLYDCTNIIKKPVIVAVSSLGIDHVNLLGHTVAEIAAHKAGIFKPGVPVVTVCQHKSAMKVLYEKALEVNCPLTLAPPLEVYEQDLKLNVSSLVQNTNASLALQLTFAWLNHVSCNNILPSKCSVNGNCDSDQVFLPMASTFPIDSKFREGLDSCVWPGRFQAIKKDGFTLYLDGAHTLQSMKYCTKWFQDASMKEQKELQYPVLRVLLFNCTGDRKAESLLHPLSDIDFDLVVFSPNRKSIMKDSSSDQSNFMIDPEQEMRQCQINKEIWCHLIGSVRENEQSMAGSQYYAAVMHNNKLSSIPKEDNNITFCCLGNAVDWLLHHRNLSHCHLCDKSTSYTDLLKKTSHVQILVTGSLHLVGGVLALTGTEL